MSRLLSISLFIFSVFVPGAVASQVCESTPECHDIIERAKIRIQELLDTRDRTAPNTGAIFAGDISVPALGEAYRDPSGLIWGRMIMGQGRNKHIMSQYDADRNCKAVGARLPTKEELEQLAKYLGKGTAQSYSPYLKDGKTDFLPGLGYSFWSSSINPDVYNFTHGYYMDSRDGTIDTGVRYDDNDIAARSVAGR